ncbi:hypothetical protein EJB05_13208, partial [Eragrostis curvula]
MLSLIFSVLFLSGAIRASSHPHPLDPLTAAELAAVGTAVRASPLIPARPLTFHYVGLDEPDKADVISQLTSLPRRALVIARAGGQSHELRVDVTNVSSPAVLWHAVHHGAGFPRFTTADEVAAAALPYKYPPFVESVRRRGLDVKDVGCGVIDMGWYGGGQSEEARWGSARVAKMQCFVASGTANFYARPLEGVVLVVDIERMAVVGYRDRVVQPVPKAEGTEYRADKVGPPFTGPAAAPGVVVQPEGSGFHIDGHVVR